MLSKRTFVIDDVVSSLENSQQQQQAAVSFLRKGDRWSGVLSKISKPGQAVQATNKHTRAAVEQRAKDEPTTPKFSFAQANDDEEVQEFAQIEQLATTEQEIAVVAENTPLPSSSSNNNDDWWWQSYVKEDQSSHEIATTSVAKNHISNEQQQQQQTDIEPSAFVQKHYMKKPKQQAQPHVVQEQVQQEQLQLLKQELEQELAHYKQENDKLRRQAADIALERQKLQFDKTEWDRTKQEQTQQWEHGKEAEMKKWNKERKALEQQAKSNHWFATSKKQLEKQVECLQMELEQAHADAKQKLSKHKQEMDRMKQTNLDFSTRIYELEQDLKQRELARIERAFVVAMDAATQTTSSSSSDAITLQPSNDKKTIPLQPSNNTSLHHLVQVQLHAQYPMHDWFDSYATVDQCMLELVQPLIAKANALFECMTQPTHMHATRNEYTHPHTPHKRYEYANGTIKTLFDGTDMFVIVSQQQHKLACSCLVQFNNGDVKLVTSAFTLYHYSSTHTIHVTFATQLEVFQFGNGQVEKHYPVDGIKEIVFADGCTCKYMNGMGEEQIVIF